MIIRHWRIIQYYTFFDIMFHVWYNKAIVGFFRQEGGERMEYLITFVISVVARVAGNYISKWLDRLKSDK